MEARYGKRLWNTPASRSVIRGGWLAWPQEVRWKSKMVPGTFSTWNMTLEKIVGVTMRCAMQRKAVQARCAVVRLANRDLPVQPAIRFFRLLSLDVYPGSGVSCVRISMRTL